MAAITHLKTRSMGWPIPSRLLPDEAQWKSLLILNGEKVVRIIIPSDAKQLHRIAVL